MRRTPTSPTPVWSKPYRHLKAWLAGPGDGAQLIVIDNSPRDLVADDVVVRYTRSARVAPDGLVEDA